MSYDLTDGSTACPGCGADLSEPDSVEMRPYDSGHLEWEHGEFMFRFDREESLAYRAEPRWTPDAGCRACGADIEGTYAIFSG